MFNFRFSNNKEGLTLVEIVVATLLLSMITVGFTSITLSSNKLLERSKRRLFAAEVAQYILESLKAHIGEPDWNSTGSAIAVTTHPTPAEGDTGGYVGWIDMANEDFLGAGCTSFAWSEFATRYGGRWQYTVANATDGYEYRSVAVDVNWDEENF